jgi:hypothetical protein
MIALPRTHGFSGNWQIPLTNNLNAAANGVYSKPVSKYHIRSRNP